MNSRFVRLPRCTPSAALLINLRKRANGDPLRVIVPLLLHGGSIGHKGIRIRWDDLSNWSGVRDELRLEEALLALEKMSALQRWSKCYQSPIDYRVNPKLLAEDRNGYTLPSKLVTESIWSALTGSERAVLWAIAANIRTHLWNDDHDPYEATRWRDEAPVARVDNGCAILSPRTGRIALRALSELTGITRPEVSRTLKRLHAVADGDLLRGTSTDEGWWHHLPEAIWFDSRDGPPLHAKGSGYVR